jgi:hypothetical protein
MLLLLQWPKRDYRMSANRRQRHSSGIYSHRHCRLSCCTTLTANRSAGSQARIVRRVSGLSAGEKRLNFRVVTTMSASVTGITSCLENSS